MKWSRNFLLEKIDSLIPHRKAAKLGIPEALEKAAIELFLLDEGHHNGSYRAYVISSALVELRESGVLEFGTVCKDWGTEFTTDKSMKQVR